MNKTQELIEKIESYKMGSLNIHSSPWHDGWFVENYTTYMGLDISAKSGIINTFSVFDPSLEKALIKFIEKLEILKKHYSEIDSFNKNINASLFKKCKVCNDIPNIIRISRERFFDSSKKEMFIGEVMCTKHHISSITTNKFYTKELTVEDMLKKWNEKNI